MEMESTRFHMETAICELQTKEFTDYVAKFKALRKKYNTRDEEENSSW